MQGAMMHCGAESIPYPHLMQIHTPEPTDTHFPIPHHQFFEVAHSELVDQGFSTAQETHYINREGAHYFALMRIMHESFRDDVGHGVMVALRNSHDKMFSASLAIGAKVFVCDNLSFSGDIVVGRKHTPNIWRELPELFSGAISKIKVMQKRQEVRFAEYKEAPLDDYTADHLIMETYRRGIINLKRIGQVHKEWTAPSADHGDKCVWRYFNAVTAALGPASANQLIQLPKKTIDLHLLLDEFTHVEFDDHPDDFVEVDGVEYRGNDYGEDEPETPANGRGFFGRLMDRVNE